MHAHAQWKELRWTRNFTISLFDFSCFIIIYVRYRNARRPAALGKNVIFWRIAAVLPRYFNIREDDNKST